MERNLGQLADLIALRASSIARSEFYDTGAYARGIHAEHGLDESGNLVGRVVATNYKSHWAEFGWRSRAGGERARHILQRAAEQVGLVVVAAGAAAAVGSGVRGIGGGGRRAIGRRAPLAITGR